MAKPLSYPDAVHLLRRAAARGRAEEARRLSELGLEAAVDSLLQDPTPAPAFKTEVSSSERGEQQRQLTQLWLTHWLNTPTPAAERLVLFWHGHFTSEFRETMGAQGSDVWAQFATFRTQGYGPLGELLKAVAHNPMMLLYLNNAESRKEHPNENWARELMELYTLGPGFYSEKDVQESARAFTGWTVRLPSGKGGKMRDPNEAFEFFFRKNWHDTGSKSFLGQPVESGDEVLEILTRHPQTYAFIGRKLLAYYLDPQPPAPLVSEGAKVLQSSGTREFLRWLFTHPEFYAPAHRASIVKSPLEYVVGLLYAAGQTRPLIGKDDGKASGRLLGLLATMGQVPFDPPTVKGWDGGMSWLAESPLLARLNLVAALAGQEPSLNLEVFMDGATGPLSLVKPEAQLL
ncbi:DUF1800 domain-containing protein [Meiothermus granaticius]|uniref:DUF1800 domain-containing protein n=1 Tax=Meiothermus granaticius NBRC 107808 TaxID=1227551 RepID=A0A399F5J9_9DEIN|nr:DUF1800 domain-containing protein [Meiothermus granaticius]RIH92047.1 hypothetical protein Mgrana_02017 [Meiothermus granaticius NBRC 107808]GEM85386.1 hypothetical protein MGR01S_00110 [Meiothermus granaticius NBRC 107808]